MSKVLITGYFHNNLGDNLFLKILSERYPNTQFEVIVDNRYASYYQHYTNVAVIRRSILYRLVDRFIRIINKHGLLQFIGNRYSAVVEIGGSIFPEVQEQSIPTEQRKYLSKKIDHYFVIGSNFGPWNTSAFLNAYKHFFSSIDGTVLRDKQSFKLFSNIQNVSYAPDVVFNLGNFRANYVACQKYVAISVINLSYSDPSRSAQLKDRKKIYEEMIVQQSLVCSHEGYNLIFVPFSEDQGDLLTSKKLAKQIRKLLEENDDFKIEVMPSESTDVDKLSVIKNASLLISTRFHSMILGWIFDIPQLVYVYSNKTRSVINDLFPEQLTVELNSQKENYSTKSSEKFTSPERKNIDLIKEEAVKQFSYLDRYLYHNKL